VFRSDCNVDYKKRLRRVLRRPKPPRQQNGMYKHGWRCNLEALTPVGRRSARTRRTHAAARLLGTRGALIRCSPQWGRVGTHDHKNLNLYSSSPGPGDLGEVYHYKDPSGSSSVVGRRTAGAAPWRQERWTRAVRPTARASSTRPEPTGRASTEPPGYWPSIL
jgi:hypothetical protein